MIVKSLEAILKISNPRRRRATIEHLAESLRAPSDPTPHLTPLDLQKAKDDQDTRWDVPALKRKNRPLWNTITLEEDANKLCPHGTSQTHCDAYHTMNPEQQEHYIRLLKIAEAEKTNPSPS